MPGQLSAETREALGIGLLAPPPWLARMRMLGLPPDYQGQPSWKGPGPCSHLDYAEGPAGVLCLPWLAKVQWAWPRSTAWLFLRLEFRA